MRFTCLFSETEDTLRTLVLPPSFSACPPAVFCMWTWAQPHLLLFGVFGRAEPRGFQAQSLEKEGRVYDEELVWESRSGTQAKNRTGERSRRRSVWWGQEENQVPASYRKR